MINPAKPKLQINTNILTQNANEIMNESEEINEICNELFPPDENEPKLIQKAKLIKDCTILKYGVKPSSEVIEYTFCKTCDINQIHPICIPCIKECHRGHNVKKTFMSGHIKCVCGEKLHSFDQVNKKDENIKCLFSEWSVTSKTNIYYLTSFNAPLCVFCHNFCSDKNNRVVHESEGSKVPECSCQNEKIHSEYKVLYEKLNKLTNEKCDVISQMHPIAILNLLFKSEKSFNDVYGNFIETMRALSSGSIVSATYQLLILTSANFTDTNCYQSLKNFTSIAECNKCTGLRYYCKEIEHYFSFDAIKRLFPPEHLSSSAMASSENAALNDNVSIWSFRQKVFLLFHKVYIGNSTQPMDKYKLHDLENLSYFQRHAIFHTTREMFPESAEIVTFLLEKLSRFNVTTFTHLEAYNAITEICSILKRLSVFSLITNGDMIRICMEIEKFFPSFSIMRKAHIKTEMEMLWHMEAKLFYIIIKMMHHFIFSFNDRLIRNIITDRKKYPTLDDICFENTNFAFDKTDLGRLISRLSIRIMSIMQRYYSERENSEVYGCIMEQGMKILSHFLYNYDSYLFSLMKSKKRISFYLELANMNESNSQLYADVKSQQKKLEECYVNYFNFNLIDDDLIREVSNSLKIVVGNENEFSDIKISAILKSNYFYSLSKIFEIVHFDNSMSITKKEFIDEVISFYFKFIRDNSDNASLVLSHYIFHALIRVPCEFGLTMFDLFHNCVKLIYNNESVLPSSFHILRNLHEYLYSLREKKYEKINEALFAYLSICKLLITKIKCIDVELIICEAKKILFELNKEFDIVKRYFVNATDELNEKIFHIFLQMINAVFTFSEETSRKQIETILNVQALIRILDNAGIMLSLRGEIIRFIRKTRIDFIFSDNNDAYYANSIITTEDKLAFINANVLISNFQYPTKHLSFKRDLLNISLKNAETKKIFDEDIYNILMHEMISLQTYIEKIKSSNNAEDIEIMQNYFENAIIIPVICFLKKNFCFANLLTGEEVLNLYDMIAAFLQVKLTLISMRKNFWNEESEDANNESNSHIIKGYNAISYSHIDGSFLRDDKLKTQTESDFAKIQTKRFSPYDYTALYLIANEHIFSLMKDKALTYIAEDFDACPTINGVKGLKQIEATFANYEEKTENEKRVIRAYLIYKIRKEGINDVNSCIFSCLHEICLEFETNFRNLLISLLICNGRNVNNVNARASYFLLFKLLAIQTTETQSDVIALLGGNESERLGFMIEFSSHLFERIVMLFIENANPNDTVVSSHYLLSYNLIKIFKFLCEEHNNFFQGRLIKGVMYSYMKLKPTMERDMVGGHESLPENEDDLSDDDDKVKQIKFFDFILHCISKIILVSKWESISKKDELKNEYLYDLFSALLELLIEIIQGNKPEYLSKIGVVETADKSDSLISSNIDSFSDSNSFFAENNDAFLQFIENTSEILFRDEVNNELIYQIRNQLMQFFIAILEEKNCNEEMQKLIIKHLNLNKVISSISSVLKSYYIQQEDLNSEDNWIANNTSIANFKTNYGVTKMEEAYTSYTKVNDNNMHSGMEIGKGNITPNTNNNNTGNNNNSNGSINNDTEKKTVNDNMMKILKISNMKFNHLFYEYFSKKYFESNDFSKSNEFQLANIFYRYIKLISVQNKSDEATSLINKISSISEKDALKRFNVFSKESNGKIANSIAPINLINENVKNFDSSFIEKFYIVKFFEGITETVEVRTGDVSGMNQTVIFTVLPEMIYLSEGTKIEFVKNVNRDSETTKKNDLIRHIGYFQKEIKYYQKRRGLLSRFFSSIDFSYIQIFVYLYAVCLNLFMLFTLSGDTRTTEIQPDARLRNLGEGGTLRSLGNKETGKIITDMINESIKDWGEYYNVVTYIFVAINGGFIALWVVFRMPLYYRLDKIKYMETHKITDKKQLTTMNKIQIALYDTIYVRNYITTLIFLFIVSLIGAILTRGEIAYPFLLLAIVNLNPTLKNIVLGIKMKYLELILTYLLAIIIMFVFSNLGFYFFNDDFNDTIGGYEDNYCASLVFCFMSALDYGLRNRGGMGDLMTRISFKRHPSRYIGRIIYDDLFFILVVIIMIDMVFGIIIESFQELGNEEQKHVNDKKNHCFICHVNRGTVEKNRKDFNEHREKIHNLWNYVNYMISLKFADIHDLNAINSYAREKIDIKNISWLPTYKDEGNNDGRNNKGDDNEDNFKVEDENINKHLVKEA